MGDGNSPSIAPGHEASGERRCAWVGDDPLYRAYHDREWGVPEHDDRRLFEMLLLEGAQAGLAWITILRKREGYRAAFDGFDPERMARYDDARLAALREDPRIVRNRLKIEAARNNARAYLRVMDAEGSFAGLLWDLAGGAPVVNRWARLEDVPVSTPASDAMSRTLKRLGFKFVGTTICYAFMQAVGMVNDHTTDCFRHTDLA